MRGHLARRIASAGVVLALAAGAVGCGSDSDEGSTSASGSSTSGAASEGQSIKATAILDVTGIAGFAGKPEQEGLELGLKQLNDSGKYDIDLTIEDTGSEQTQAVNLMNQAARSDADIVFFGPLSSEALALAPIAQREKVPFVAMQSGVTGVVEAGDYVFRATTPQQTFFPALFDYLQEEGVKRIGMFYASDSATIKELAEKVMPPLAEERGMEVASKDTVTSTQTDFKSIASKIAQENPDAVFAGTQGTQNVTVVQQLRRAGYDGIIFNSGGFAGGVLDPLKEDADALVYPVWFAPETDLSVGKQFVADYQADYGSEPNTFAGEAFDASLLLKNALDQVDGDVTRESLQQAMVAATEAGFPGAQGEPLAFENRDARGSGFVIRRDDGKDAVVKSPEAG